MTVNLSIRELIVAVERRKGISMRCHVTLEDLARSLLCRWPRMIEAMSGSSLKPCASKPWKARDPEQARAAFVAAVRAADMLHERFALSCRP